MNDFFISLEPAEKFYWAVALISSLIFAIQSIMTFIGADADDTSGVEADFDGNLEMGDYPFQLFSLRNLVNFFLGLGWTGAVFYNSIDNKIVLSLLAIGVGFLLIAIFFFVMKSIMKLAEDNSFKMNETIGKMADVYITIPGNKKGKGKITISVKGSTRELDAITEDDEDIKSRSLVKILRVVDNILVVTTK